MFRDFARARRNAFSLTQKWHERRLEFIKNEARLATKLRSRWVVFSKVSEEGV